MRREITIENIRANLIKEYGTKPIRKAKISIAAGILIAILCFATGRTIGNSCWSDLCSDWGNRTFKSEQNPKKD